MWKLISRNTPISWKGKVFSMEDLEQNTLLKKAFQFIVADINLPFSGLDDAHNWYLYQARIKDALQEFRSEEIQIFSETTTTFKLITHNPYILHFELSKTKECQSDYNSGGASL